MARANVTVVQAPHNNADWAVFAKMFQDAMKQRQAQEANQATYEGLASAGQNTADQVIAPYADRASQTGNAVVTDQRNIDAINTPVTGAGNPDTLPNTSMLHQAMRTNTPMPETEQGSVDTKQLSKDMQPQIANLQADLHAALAGDAAAQSKLAQVKTQVGDGMWNSMSEYVKRGMPADKAYAVIMKSIESANDKVAKQEFSDIIKNMPNDPTQKESYLMKYAGNPMVDKILQPILSRQPAQPHLSIAPDGTVVDMRTGQPVSGAPKYIKPETPKVSYSPTTYKDEQGREYQLDSRGQRHYAPSAPKADNAAALAALNHEESMAKQYWAAQKPDQIASKAKHDEWLMRGQQLEAEYKAKRDALTKSQTGSFDPNNLTPSEFEEAKKLKDMGLSKEQVLAELKSRRGSEKSH